MVCLLKRRSAQRTDQSSRSYSVSLQFWLRDPLIKMQIKMFRAVGSDPFSERLKENLTFRNRSFFALVVGRLSGFKPTQMVGLHGYRRLTHPTKWRWTIQTDSKLKALEAYTTKSQLADCIDTIPPTRQQALGQATSANTRLEQFQIVPIGQLPTESQFALRQRI